MTGTHWRTSQDQMALTGHSSRWPFHRSKLAGWTALILSTLSCDNYQALIGLDGHVTTPWYDWDVRGRTCRTYGVIRGHDKATPDMDNLYSLPIWLHGGKMANFKRFSDFRGFSFSHRCLFSHRDARATFSRSGQWQPGFHACFCDMTCPACMACMAWCAYTPPPSDL